MIRDTWRFQLTMAIDFISSKDTDKERVMHSKNDNVEFMIYDSAEEVIEELFESLLNTYQFRLQTSMRGSNFMLDFAYFLYNKCYKINPNCGGSYKNSSD